MTKDEYWQEYSSKELCMYHAYPFDEWWDPERYNWENKSWALANHCSKHFNIWWDAEKYNWSDFYILSKNCLDKFTDSQLKQLFLHSDKKVRTFAKEEFDRRENDKGRVLGKT